MKRQFILLALIMLTMFSQAQVPNDLWEFNIGSAAADYGESITTDGSGNIYVTGYFKNTVDLDPSGVTANLSSLGQEDIFVAKYNSSGAYQWAFSIGSTGDDMGLSITTDVSGNVYLTGYFSGTADFDPSGGTADFTPVSADDIFVAKYNSSGAYQWAFQVGGSADDKGRGITIDGSGNIYLTGEFAASVDFDPGAGDASLFSGGWNDIFVAKYNSSGDYQWAFSVGSASTANDVAYGVKTDASGNVYVTGFFGGTADFDPGAGLVNLAALGSADIFLAKYNSSGDYQWAFNIGSGNEAKAFGIAIDASSNVYITGYFDLTADFDPSAGTSNLISGGFIDTYVAKYSSAGVYQWAFKIGGGGYDIGYAITTDVSGNIYVTGYFKATVDFNPGPGIANLTYVGGSDIFVAKYNSSGDYQWAFKIGTDQNDEGHGIITDASGNIYLTGFFQGTSDFDPDLGTANLTSAGLQDIFVAKYKECNITTNFTTTDVSCNGGSNGSATISASGEGGAYTYSWNTTPVQTTASATGLIPGTYMATLTTPNGCVTYQQNILIAEPTVLAFTYSQVDVDCNGADNGSITVTENGGTGTKQYSKDNGVNYQASNIFSGLAQGTYTIVVKDANNCLTASQDVTITEPQVLSFTYSQSNVLCNGGNTGTITVTTSGGTGTKYYSRDGGTNFQSSNILSGLTSGTYSVVVKDANNCVTAAQDVTITEPTTILSNISSQENVHCNGGSNGSVTITASGGTGSLDYLWSSGGATTTAINNLSEGTYTCTITDDNNCTHTQNVIISEPAAIVDVPVCLVTVDSSSIHNIIYWEKPVNALIDTFFIYREVTSNNFVKIASVPYDSLNEYHDYAADPNVTSYKYKVSVLDTCGFESAESDYHNTIHLQNLGSGSLQWTLYDIENSGNPVTYYRVYRDDVGNGNFQPISSTIPGSNSTYTDVNYSSFPNAVYVVDVNWNISCTPYRSSVTTTRSNTWSPLTVGMGGEIENSIKIYPNPASQLITIEIPNSINVLNMKIYNLLGEVIYDDASFDKAKKQINVEEFAKGVYTIKIETEFDVLTKKQIVQ